MFAMYLLLCVVLLGYQSQRRSWEERKGVGRGATEGNQRRREEERGGRKEKKGGIKEEKGTVAETGARTQGKNSQKHEVNGRR